MSKDQTTVFTKSELRLTGLNGRRGIEAGDRPVFDRRICEAVISAPAFASAHVVMVYRSFGGEVNVDAIADAAIAAGKTVVYPYCADKTTILALLPNGPEAWAQGSFGIWEPVRERSQQIDPADIDLIVLPCAAFDDDGNRIGMGAGYYDRFLPKCTKAKTILVAYEEQRVNGIVPDTYDVRADLVVTQNTEWLDIVDEDGIPTGEIISREVAHRTGIRHRTAHVWLVREREGRRELLLQKRSMQKESYPGFYDISSAGHIPAGVEYVPSALRELEEELGLRAEPEELIFCGTRRFTIKEVFRDRLYWDCQVSNVYLLWRDIEETQCNVQTSELQSVRWMDMHDCIKMVKTGMPQSCVQMEELEMISACLSSAK